MKKDQRNIVIVCILIVLGAWLLGLLSSTWTPTAEPAAKTSNAPTPAKPDLSTPIAKNAPPPAVALPILPPVKASQSTEPESAAPSIDQTARAAQFRTTSRGRAIINSLRQISAAAQQYMLEQGATSVSYSDLVDYYNNRFGIGTENLLRNITPVAGEDFTKLNLQQDTTEISVVTADGITVTFSQ